MGKFDGFLLVSDFDGTLIDDRGLVSSDNLQAIRSFTAQGGRFVGATGRSELNVRPYTDAIDMVSPWILYNGAAIFDWASNAFIYKTSLNRGLAQAFVSRVMTRFAGINVQVFAGGPFIRVNPSALPDNLAVQEEQFSESAPMETVGEPWLKVLFCSDFPAELDTIEAMLSDDPLQLQAHKTRSAPRYFELTAQGVNKGSALAHLRTLLQPTPRRVIAIGDYINDIEMLQEADIAAAPENAHHEVKQCAQIITVSHTQSAIADLVRRLEAMPPT